jgi:hypothetical protein
MGMPSFTRFRNTFITKTAQNVREISGSGQGRPVLLKTVFFSKSA